ncbi:MAG: TetR family transcriptional regulator [Myxococcota bacterium]
MTGKRARDDHAKSLKRRALLEAARQLLATTRHDDVSMSQLARAAGVAKGTLYLYFSTREEVFVEILTDELNDWFATLTRVLSEHAGRITPEQVGEAMAGTLAERATLLELWARLHPVLEQNIETSAATEFRRRLRDRLLPLGELMESKVAQLEPGDGFRVLLWTEALVLGLHQLANPTTAVAKALGALDLAMFRVDFSTELARSIATMLRGWRA